jgi:uncharacterized protein YbjT (DUF2867 family)
MAKDPLHAVVGITGQTGSATADALLARGARVRAVVRDRPRAEPWAARGTEVGVADLADAESLAAAFDGAASAFVLNPPAYTLPDLFARAEEIAASVLAAARRARLPRLAVLSSIGAHLPDGTGNVRTNTTFERVLGAFDGAVTFLRPAYFMENWAWVAAVVQAQGVLPSFLGPADRAIPMVSVADIGETAADAMLGPSGVPRVVEIAGPVACSPADAAAAFGEALGRPVSVAVVPEAEWRAALEGWRFTPRTIDSWIELFQGFNSGHIAFEGNGRAAVSGRTSIQDAVRRVLARRPPA